MKYFTGLIRQDLFNALRELIKDSEMASNHELEAQLEDILEEFKEVISGQEIAA